MDEKNGFLELEDGEETEEGLLDFEFEELSEDDTGAGGEAFDTEEILELTDIAEPEDVGVDDVSESELAVYDDEDAAAGAKDELSFDLDALDAEIEESLSVEEGPAGEGNGLVDAEILDDDAIEDGEDIEDIDELESGPPPLEAESDGTLSEAVDLEAIMGEVEEFDDDELEVEDVEDMDAAFEELEEGRPEEAEPLGTGDVTEEPAISELEPEAVEPAFELRDNNLTEGPVDERVGESLAGISEERLEAIVRRTVQEVVEKVAREAMKESAEKVIRESIDALKSSIESLKG